MKRYIQVIIELCIWALIVLLVAFGIFVYNNYKNKFTPHYHIFVQDADGLRKGAPVRLMGVEIGFVSDINTINNDEIFITFELTKDKTLIPNGTTANIESTGIVGSKSLELYPPDKNSSKVNLINVKSPDRIQGAMQSSVVVSDIIYNASYGFNKVVKDSDVPYYKVLIHSVLDKFPEYERQIDNINKQEDELIYQVEHNEAIKKFNKKMENIKNGK